MCVCVCVLVCYAVFSLPFGAGHGGLGGVALATDGAGLVRRHHGRGRDGRVPGGADRFAGHGTGGAALCVLALLLLWTMCEFAGLLLSRENGPLSRGTRAGWPL